MQICVCVCFPSWGCWRLKLSEISGPRLKILRTAEDSGGEDRDKLVPANKQQTIRHFKWIRMRPFIFIDPGAGS